jgi:glycosyltransferase involved in cell wall biosynthesis
VDNTLSFTRKAFTGFFIDRKENKSNSGLSVDYSDVKDNFLISIIIPTLDEEKLLESHLRLYSPEIREKYNLELIVSDGGSTDGTLEKAKNYADALATAHPGKRQTIADGRNQGAKISNGDTLVFINADSIPKDVGYFLDFVTEWSNGKGKYTDCGALACKITVFPEERLLRDDIFYTLHNAYVRFLNVLGIGMGRGECQIVRRDVFKRVGGYNPDIVAGEDFDLYRRISRISPVGFAKELVVCESPRRFRKYGYLHTLFSWTINSLSVMFFGRSVSREWKAIR